MEGLFNPNDYQDVKVQVKVILGKDAAETNSKADIFSKLHKVIETKQTCPTVKIIFYHDE